MGKLKLPLAIYLVGALVDDALTYLYVKLWGIYAEANPIIALHLLDKPLWMWGLKELAGVAIAVAMCFGYRGLIESLIARISNPKPSKACMKILNCMKDGWLWPLWLAAVIRLLPAIHNVLLIFFNVESPLSRIIEQMLSPLIFWALAEAMSAWRGTSHEPSSTLMAYVAEQPHPDPLSACRISRT